MSTVISRLSIAVLLAAGAWLARSETRVADRVADAKERLATLDLAIDDTLRPSATLSDYLPGGPPPLATDIRRTRTTVEYWLSRYGDVMDEANGELDSEILLAAANAAFRAHEREGGGGLLQVQRLDGVLQAYVAVLKSAPRHMDAAFNYEYVSRVRDRVARGPQDKPASAPPMATAAAIRPGDLPAGATVHGHPGGPPPEMKGEEIEVIAPMNYGDREAQPEATPGAKRERKG